MNRRNTLHALALAGLTILLTTGCFGLRFDPKVTPDGGMDNALLVGDPDRPDKSGALTVETAPDGTLRRVTVWLPMVTPAGWDMQHEVTGEGQLMIAFTPTATP